MMLRKTEVVERVAGRDENKAGEEANPSLAVSRCRLSGQGAVNIHKRPTSRDHGIACRLADTDRDRDQQPRPHPSPSDRHQPSQNEKRRADGRVLRHYVGAARHGDRAARSDVRATAST